MPTISYPSLKELRSLQDNGFLESDGLTINLGKEPLAISTLQVLIRKYQEGDLDTSTYSMGAFIDEIGSLAKNLKIEESDRKSLPKIIELRKKIWRIIELRAQNFRGLTDFNGPEFSFDFSGKPFIIYGSNGSGKTSILSALTWCFTGMCIKERCEPDDEATCGISLFERNNEVNPLIKDWPFVVTVPHNKKIPELKSLVPTCTVEAKIIDESGLTVTLKRSVVRGTISALEIFSENGEILNIDDLKVNDLDLELSMLMPARIMNIKFQPGSKISENLISVAGLDALLELGNSTRRLASSVARYKTAEDKQCQSLIEDAVEGESKIKDDENTSEILDEIYRSGAELQREKDESDNIYKIRVLEKQIEELEEKGKNEFKAISEKIGVSPATHEERKSLIESLRQARIKIGENTDNWTDLQSWKLITNDILQNATNVLMETVKDVSSDLNKQYILWSENEKKKGLLSVKIVAANYCSEIDNFKTCPVCQRDLPVNIIKELSDLAKQKKQLVHDLNHYVRDLREKIEFIFPIEIKNLNSSTKIKTQIRDIIIQKVWNYIKPLGKLKDDFGEKVKLFISSLSEQDDIEKRDVFRNDEWEEKFKQCVGGLESIVIDYKEKLSIAKWVLNNFAEVENFIEEHIFRDSKTSDLQEGTESLISNLKRLEKYSEQFEIIDRIKESLNTVLGKYKKAESHKENIKKANDVHENLNRLKDLDKYASALLNDKLDSVSEEMKEIYDDLYPTDPIRLDKIASQKTRAGTKPDYRFRLRWTDELLADAEPVANLGRIRAILWSFVFALIKKHEPVLKTIIIDDPVISLDDYHAQNMVEDIIAKRLSSEYQPIITIHQEGLLHERWGRDPQGKDMGFAKALTRDSNHRSCRIKPSWEPLTNAIENFKDDRDKWLEVIIQARISLENHLKALAPYLSTTDVSSETLDNVVEILKQSRDNKKNSTNICRFVNIGELVRLYESKVAKKVLNISLHGGPDRSNLTAYDADDIVKNHLKWRDDINKRYIEIEKALIRKTSKAAVIVDGISEPANIANLLSILDAKNQIFQIGEVAAEGQFSVFAEEPSEMPSFDWPSCYYGILTSQGCRPLAWEGQIILVADGLDVNDGDIALVQCAEKNFLRRIYQVPINGELDKGWACIAINPVLNQIKPEIFRADEVILYKYVGVLFPLESERLENARLSGGEVVRQTGSWPNVLKSMAKNQLYLVKVKGNSAEPLALDGQYLIIEKADRYENSLHMAPCCVVLSDDRALFKRFCFSVNSEKRALLQPFNVAEPHPVIEIGLSQDINDAGGEAENLPILKQLFLVRGIMIDNPEGLKPLDQ